MTLFLLLVSIACLTPLCGVLLDFRQGHLLQNVLALILALVCAAGQWITHHALLPRLLRSRRDDSFLTVLITLYYVAIPVGGAICLLLVRGAVGQS